MNYLRLLPISHSKGAPLAQACVLKNNFIVTFGINLCLLLRNTEINVCI